MSTRSPTPDTYHEEWTEAAVFAELAADALDNVPSNSANGVAATLAADSVRAGLAQIRAALPAAPPAPAHGRNEDERDAERSARALFLTLSLAMELARHLRDHTDGHPPCEGDCWLCQFGQVAEEAIVFCAAPRDCLDGIIGYGPEVEDLVHPACRAIYRLIEGPGHRGAATSGETTPPPTAVGGPPRLPRGNPPPAEELYVLWDAATGAAEQLQLQLAGHKCEPTDGDRCPLCGLETTAQHALWALEAVSQSEGYFDGLNVDAHTSVCDLEDLAPRLRLALQDMLGAGQGEPPPVPDVVSRARD